MIVKIGSIWRLGPEGRIMVTLPTRNCKLGSKIGSDDIFHEWRKLWGKSIMEEEENIRDTT